MSCSLFVNNLPTDVNLDDLIIYFQSKTKSDGGDVAEATKLDNGQATVVFEERESLIRVLQKKHEIGGCKLEISDTPFKGKPNPNERQKANEAEAKEMFRPKNEEAHLSKTRTLIVRGFSPDVTDEVLELFFESNRKTGGGEIEKLDRCGQDVAQITFKSAEVVEQILKRDGLELSGYRLQLEGKQPESIPSLEKFQHRKETRRIEIRRITVRGFCPDVTDQTLEMFFENSRKSGGGEIEKLERCGPDVAHITFKSAEVAERILQRGGNLELSGYKLRLEQKKPEAIPPLKKELTQHGQEEAYLGEVRTVIVSGFGSHIKDEVLEMFFESYRRSRGGDIEKLERCEPDIAHITFKSAEVASRVLNEADKLELDSYHLQVKEKQPELILPLDRKKIFVENIDPKTTKDSLLNYIELRAKAEASGVEFGDNRNAVVTFSEIPDIKNVLQNNKSLEGAVLKFSNPPVCNSVLVAGLTKDTTKQTIEMYFENERNGGGKIYGDIIYQKDKGKAVVSFCDPRVVQTLGARQQKLDGSVLSLSEYYPFMKTITETTTKSVKLSSDVMDHIIKNCEKEIRDLFGAEILQVFKECTDELMLPTEVANEVETYITQFVVKDVPFCAKLLKKSKKELKMLINTVKENDITIALEEEQLQIKLTGKKKEVNEIYEQFKRNVAEIEKRLEVVTEQIKMPEQKLELLLFHGVGQILENDFNVNVKIEPQRGLVTLSGEQNQVSLAEKEVFMKGTQIEEDTARLNPVKGRFLQSGGLNVLNNGMKEIGLKGIISWDSKATKAKLLVFEDANIEKTQSFSNSNMFEKQYSLDEDSVTLFRRNKWKEFRESINTNTSVAIDETSSGEISLTDKKKEIEETCEAFEEFMKRNTIITDSIKLTEGYAGYLSKYCIADLKEVEKKLEEQSVRLVFLEDEGVINIDGTKDGVKQAKSFLLYIVSTIAKGTINFDKPRMQEYLESEGGEIFISGIETKHKCFIIQTKDDGEQSTAMSSYRFQPALKLLCSYETQERIELKVYKGDITTHHCDVIVNAANGDLRHVGGLPKNITLAGGEEIQEECDAHVKKNGRLYEGECFSGSPGKLPCKRLIHAVAPRWDDSRVTGIRKLLNGTCCNVLEEAMTYRSIAFPAIGSGIHEVPKDVCAEVMIDAAEEFSRTSDYSNLKEIHFVNNDDASCQVFVRKFHEKFGGRYSFKKSQKTGGIRGRFGPSSPKIKESKKEVPDAAPGVVPRRSGDNFIITPGNMTISVAIGDLSTYKADVLVNSTGENLNLDSSPCSRAMSNEAGPVLQNECNKIGKLKAGEVAVTKGGNLLCDQVYHVSCVPWAQGQGEEVLRTIIKNCLQKCHSSEKTSIAFPGIGTGILAFPHDVAAKIFFEETKKFEQRVSTSSIKEVSFVVYSQDAKSVEAFKNTLKKQEEWGKSGQAAPAVFYKTEKRKRGSKSKSLTMSDPFEMASVIKIEDEGEDEGEDDPGMIKRHVNFLSWKSDSTTASLKEEPAVITKTLSLEIYAKDVTTVELARVKILSIMESQKKREKIEDEIIDKLSMEEITKIKYIGDVYDVKVTIDKKFNRIFVDGHGDDVAKMFVKVHYILTKIRDEERKKANAALQDDFRAIFSQGVQWCCVDTTNDVQQEYDKRTNAKIEKAYRKQEESVIFLLDDEKYEIVFDKMQETNLSNNETMKVIRKDFKDVTVPEYWESQPRDANGKETRVHLVCLDPNKPNHKDEYKEISDLFNNTAVNQKIVQIERIQNPSLFKLYLIKKRSLDEKNGSNEMLLFHGTKGDKLQEINESGLNRNYAGINGTAFGKGVYFAKDASMSAGYSQTDSAGKKYMYVARVAVGQYTKGETTMLVPPPKGGKSNECYDSAVNQVTNPTIYVMFYDYQYYSEYLITFT